jgi:nitrite reductase/ring-hydroxylating ferredoxin subunit
MRRLCGLDEIAEDGLLAIELPAASAIDPDSVLVHRAGSEVRAWFNVCPHAGSRLDWAPGRFLRDGSRLVCAHHGAVFELGAGLCVSGPCRGQSLSPVPVAIRDGDVWLDDEADNHRRSG